MKKIKIIFLISFLIGLNNLYSNNDSLYHFIRKPLKLDYIKFTTIPISGIMDGIRESSHFYKVPDYLNPNLTWTNKYKNHDPNQGEAFIGSTTVLVGFTDWYHRIGTIRSISNLTYIGIITYKFSNYKYSKKQLLLEITKELLLNFIIYNSSKTITMNYFKYK